MSSGINLDGIPRYAEPTWAELATDDEPPTGACWNCEHSIDVEINGKIYLICVSERDDGSGGNVSTCDPNLDDCIEWEPER
jgi:hypothetical protein